MRRIDSCAVYYVYMLECADSSYYVGLTRNEPNHRVAEHNEGKHGGYTLSRRPVKLVWSQDFSRLTQAIAIERQLKGWRREKKKALIEGRYDLLPDLARTAKTHPSTSSG
jgi:putative endonuclease